MKKTPPLPPLNGIHPSYLHLPHRPPAPAPLLLDYLCHKFPFIGRDTWAARLDSGFVAGSDGRPLNRHTPFLPGQTIYYYRDTGGTEPRVPFDIDILHIDGHLIAVDKPPFLPVTPGGRFLHETVLTRLRRHPDLQHLDTAAISPLHRLDKDTGGVMLFSRNPSARGAYQRLFQERAVAKTYQAIAPVRPDLAFPCDIRSRLVRGEAFFLTQTVAGEPNAHTRIELIETANGFGRYRLMPVSGKKHQLRVHMASLGIPILNDRLYPEAQPDGPDDFAKPLQLLALSIAFTDPFSGQNRRFDSRRSLALPTGTQQAV
ncbi:pseudouridine synthase [Neisseria leonii]|uniref:Pseudouridine synthase n=1 Tax=Neisseria leonii TaxID=2995413 RepID=A0A9X4E2Q2_9NEIS|nr:pseudouridine synthase [Neisseria sp. 51.81]MDD9327615.1 pseudouridine synthase [Neisseria sp. 51.81]